MTDHTSERMKKLKQRGHSLFGDRLLDVSDFIREFALTYANMETESCIESKPFNEDWQSMCKGMLYLSEQVSILDKESPEVVREVRPAVRSETKSFKTGQ